MVTGRAGLLLCKRVFIGAKCPCFIILPYYNCYVQYGCDLRRVLARGRPYFYICRDGVIVAALYSLPLCAVAIPSAIQNAHWFDTVIHVRECEARFGVGVKPRRTRIDSPINVSLLHEASGPTVDKFSAGNLLVFFLVVHACTSHLDAHRCILNADIIRVKPRRGSVRSCSPARVYDQYNWLIDSFIHI